jgi:hypothetical protein
MRLGSPEIVVVRSVVVGVVGMVFTRYYVQTVASGIFSGAVTTI